MSQRNRILDIAEHRMRERGYNAVSFRDIAGEIGIKSASLHYHFPKKADLGVELVNRYANTFHAALDASDSLTTDPWDRIKTFVDLHRNALVEQELLCLCAVFGAESRGLPEDINSAVTDFFKRNISWLTKAYEAAGVENANVRAKAGVSILEGALIVANSVRDNEVIEAASDFVLQR